jgi:hypothetical protein
MPTGQLGELVGFDISSIFAGGISGVFSGISDVVSKFKTDPTVAAQNAEKLTELQIAIQQAQMQAEYALQQAQIEIDKTEAASNDKYASRWRPSAGWLGVLGLAYSVVVYPLLTWASLNFGWKSPPALDTGVLVTLLMGMLGLGTMRTYEKTQGTTPSPVRPK